MALREGQESCSNTYNSNSTLKWKFDVFLSFTGKDTRLKFIDHLHAALQRRGIIVFRDDEGIQKGHVIKQQLLKAIEDSLFAILVLSQNYAFSTWCLDELQKILEARNQLGRQVFPIFYDVDPSDIRNQGGNFGKALAKHDERFKDKEKVQRWRDALTQVANLSGWDSRGCHEADLIEKVVGQIWRTLCSKLPSYSDNLVGIDSSIAKMNIELKIGLDDIRFVGIWGMGGIGKTTLARAVYKRFSAQFDACCFLANVREASEKEKDGQTQLQGKLISQLSGNRGEILDTDHGKEIIKKLCFNKKVLLVLDDVNHTSQLENLAESPEWFGAGSRVIITTRDMHLLESHGVHGVFKIEMMNEDESLQLFSKKAFKKDYPEEGYLKLSKFVVQYSGGLPLALKTLGSFLCGRSIPEWNSALARLKKIPNKDIHQILRISYDGLNDDEKTMFLDVACFFNGWERDLVISMFECCGFYPTIGLSILIEKSLLIVKDNFYSHRLEMHDLLRELGRSIVLQESPCSRLWDPKDIDEVLKNDKGIEAIQVIEISDKGGLYKFHEACWHPEAFSKMCNLRLLIGSSKRNYSSDYSDNLWFSYAVKCLFSATKVVCWPEYPLETLPPGGPLDRLHTIHMPRSNVKQLWHGRQCFGELKSIDMANSYRLIETPDFSGIPNLEKLNLADCQCLVKIHPSLGELKKLVRVNLRKCTSLTILPRKLETNNLIELILADCFKVKKIPEFGEEMKNLSLLDLEHTAITELPESLEFLTALTHLNLRFCRDLFGHPHTFHNLKLLKTLEMCFCESFFYMKSETRTERVPSSSSWSFFNLTSLTELSLKFCGISDESFLHHFGFLSSVVALNLDGNNFKIPSGCFSNLLQLRYLFLCSFKMRPLPELPPSIIRFEAALNLLLEPLGDEHMWNLFSSLDHQRRCGSKYLGTKLANIKSEYHPCRDFVAVLKAEEIPSWFPHRLNEGGEIVSITVDIPQFCRCSEWSGIAVCLKFSHGFPSFIFLSWESKALGDHDYEYKGWTHRIHGLSNLCLMLLHFNDETCWKHLRGDNSQFQVQFSCRSGERRTIEECGWRVLCKQEMEEWRKANKSNNNFSGQKKKRRKNNDFNEFSDAETGPSEVWIPDSAVDRTLCFNH